MTPAVSQILHEECEAAQVSPHDVLSPSRRWPVVAVRHRVWKRICEELRPRNRMVYSYPAIARMFNRDHSTLVHAMKKLEARNG
jgi:chromosomal replication initiation ATPase DnaA